MEAERAEGARPEEGLPLREGAVLVGVAAERDENEQQAEVIFVGVDDFYC